MNDIDNEKLCNYFGIHKWGDEREETVKIDNVVFRVKGIEHFSGGKLDGIFLTGIMPEERILHEIKEKLGWL